MRIIFICGSLEPGRDGVGDYTLRLAGELIRIGNKATIISLNDRFVNAGTRQDQSADGTLVPVFRIPSILSRTKAFKRASEIITELNPDWISLQFVPFAYHHKGLSVKLCCELKDIVKECKLHIMFHELWLGIYGEVKIRTRILGVLQKILIKQLINSANPQCITTTLPIYKNSLPVKGVKLLPLFGNIPVVDIEKTVENATDSIIAVHFGNFSGLTHGFQEQLQFLKKLEQATDRTLELKIIGNGGPFRDKALAISCQILGNDKVSEIGHASANNVSLWFQTADIGISRADSITCAKSGSTVAMLEHGLPVLLRGKQTDVNTIPLSNPAFNKQIIFCDSNVSEVLYKAEKKSSLLTISEMLLEYLET